MSLLATIAAWLRPEPPPAPPKANGERATLFSAIQKQHEQALTDLAHELDPNAQRQIRHLIDERRLRQSREQQP